MQAVYVPSYTFPINLSVGSSLESSLHIALCADL
jgi:hypothetical protein